MVDFKKLRAAKTHSAVVDPIEIFRRLPKAPGVNDLYTSQAEVLQGWFGRRGERDLVVKLHTGGGKTLVALLIGQSAMNERQEPVVYLCPTVQLVDQTVARAKEYGIPATPYVKGADLPDDFLSGKSVFVCTYQALFNGHSKFGVKGGAKETIRIGTAVLDDAHVAFPAVRDCFTLRITRQEHAEAYSELAGMFRHSFKDIGKLATFDDVVSGSDDGVLEIPYWSWQERADHVRQYLRPFADDQYPFVWPLIRDSFEYCLALVTASSFAITSMLPLVDMIPSFSECPRRLYLSATIADDSSIVRTFGADMTSVSKPITSRSLAGVSERMILSPELIGLDAKKATSAVKRIIRWASEKLGVSVVILVPSGAAAQDWTDVSGYPDSSEKVARCVSQLQQKDSKGPFVFANRYDGIDLPGDACRILVMHGMPKGTSEYDQFRATIFPRGAGSSTAIAQRIEQGIGRGARGSGDYCVVILTGNNLASWIGRSANLKALANSTRAQIEIGLEISRTVTDVQDFARTIHRCLQRDKDWVEYHAETLAELTAPSIVVSSDIEDAQVERVAFRLFRDGYHDKAVKKILDHLKQSERLDPLAKGWLLQTAARIANHWGNTGLAQELEREAYASNRNLARPRVKPQYVALKTPGKQAASIIAMIGDYKLRGGYLAEYDEITSRLVPEASSNQFEQAMADLGRILGFHAERPDDAYGQGPDILWLAAGNLGFVIEAKSRKRSQKPLNKEDHGQLLQAEEWFKLNYPGYSDLRICIHHNATITRSVAAGATKALTYAKLSDLIVVTRSFLAALCDSASPREEMLQRCEDLLGKFPLVPHAIAEQYLLPFTVDDGSS